MNEDILYTVVKKIIGDIKPLGCATIDPERMENMKLACSLVEKLLTDIDNVAYLNRNSQEYSVKQIADYAKKFLDKLGLPE
jgi:cysteinyl-tRNA synthetase